MGVLLGAQQSCLNFSRVCLALLIVQCLFKNVDVLVHLLLSWLHSILVLPVVQGLLNNCPSSLHLITFLLPTHHFLSLCSTFLSCRYLIILPIFTNKATRRTCSCKATYQRNWVPQTACAGTDSKADKRSHLQTNVATTYHCPAWPAQACGFGCMWSRNWHTLSCWFSAL